MMFGQQVKLDAKALRSAREEVFLLAKSEISDYLTETVLAEFPDSDVRGPRLFFFLSLSVVVGGCYGCMRTGLMVVLCLTYLCVGCYVFVCLWMFVCCVVLQVWKDLLNTWERARQEDLSRKATDQVKQTEISTIDIY